MTDKAMGAIRQTTSTSRSLTRAKTQAKSRHCALRPATAGGVAVAGRTTCSLLHVLLVGILNVVVLILNCKFLSTAISFD